MGVDFRALSAVVFAAIFALPIYADGAGKFYKILGADGRIYLSSQAAKIGGYRARKIVGRLDCQSAAAAIARGGYVKERVFFRSLVVAEKLGYRPCGRCLPRAYAEWKAGREWFEIAKKELRP